LSAVTYTVPSACREASMPENHDEAARPGKRVSALSNVLPSSIEMRNLPSSVPT
jgi:hypothetical protein